MAKRFWDYKLADSRVKIDAIWDPAMSAPSSRQQVPQKSYTHPSEIFGFGQHTNKGWMDNAHRVKIDA